MNEDKLVISANSNLDYDFSTIKLDDLDLDQITIAAYTTMQYNPYMQSSAGINYSLPPLTNYSGTFITSNLNSSWINPSAPSSLKVDGDAEIEGDIKWKGRSLGSLLEKIEDRLAIICDPDPEKLERFKALKKAYENYKTLERLIGDHQEPKE